MATALIHQKVYMLFAYKSLVATPQCRGNDQRAAWMIDEYDISFFEKLSRGDPVDSDCWWGCESGFSSRVFVASLKHHVLGKSSSTRTEWSLTSSPYQQPQLACTAYVKVTDLKFQPDFRTLMGTKATNFSPINDGLASQTTSKSWAVVKAKPTQSRTL